MNAKQFVELVSRMTLGEGECLDGLITTAREILSAGSEKGEAKKERQDRERAQAAIAAIDKFVASAGQTNRLKCFGNEPPIPMEILAAAKDEQVRLEAALDSGDAFRLKRIFRRKET